MSAAAPAADQGRALACHMRASRECGRVTTHPKWFLVLMTYIIKELIVLLSYEQVQNH